MLTEIRKTFIAGLLVTAPLALTIYIFFLLFRFFDNILKDVVTNFLSKQIHLDLQTPGVGIIALLIIIFLTGTIARNYFGGKLLAIGDYIVTKIPLINRIYLALREISEAILSEKREVFKKAVLIEYPHKNMYSIAFFTQDTSGPVQEALSEDVVSVLVVTTPNPTTGYLLFVPKKDIVELDMAVEDALKLVVSGGSIHLKNKQSIIIPGLSGRGKRKKKKVSPVTQI